MSATEYGHHGAFVCFYCECTWLPGDAVEGLLARFPGAPPLWQLLQPSASAMPLGASLSCPTYDGRAFRRYAHGGWEVSLCRSCGGMYFPKGAFEHAFPGATREEFRFGAAGTAVAMEGLFWAAVVFFAGAG